MAAVASIFRTDRGLIHMVPSPTLGPAADRASLASWFRSFRLVAGFRILAAQSGRSTQTTLETQSLLAGAVQARKTTPRLPSRGGTAAGNSQRASTIPDKFL